MLGSRRKGKHNYHRHNDADDHYNLKPLHDQPQQQKLNTVVTDADDSSSQTQSSSQQFLDFTPKSPTCHRKPKSRSRNRSVRKEYVKKSEPDSESIEVGSLVSEVDGLTFDDEVISKEPEDTEQKLNTIDEGADSGKTTEEDYTLRILEELRSCVDEPELTEEQLNMNDQLQEYEVLAMESIYGENVLILEKHKGLRYFQIYIQIEPSTEQVLTAKLNSSSHSNDKSEDFLYSFKVDYLPPIVLNCLLPKSYPTDLPPLFTISAQWLHPSKISTLCSFLDSIWLGQPGVEVIYQWADWLQNSSLSYLGCDKEIILGPYDIAGVKDKRAISGISSPEADVPYIKTYNDEKCHETFLKSLHECSICYSEYIGTDFVKLPCQHYFCKTCMKTFSDMHVSEGTINKLRCPDTKCGSMVPPGLLKWLLGDEEFERWESMMLQKTLDSMSDIVYCPRCETPCIEDEDQDAQCSKCYFSFCTLCRDRRHVGIACMTPEAKLRILEERQNSTNVREDQRRKERDMINEILSMKEITKTAKQCPSCKMAISRTEGCNKMVCGNCGGYFCYNCQQAIDGYEHYREGSCQLFTQEMLRGWEENLNPRQAVAQVQAQVRAQLFPGQGARGQLCPSCRQFNAKMGNNNHIFCWACQVNYCYLCRKVVRNFADHFGPNRCKQHSEG